MLVKECEETWRERERGLGKGRWGKRWKVQQKLRKWLRPLDRSSETKTTRTSERVIYSSSPCQAVTPDQGPRLSALSSSFLLSGKLPRTFLIQSLTTYVRGIKRGSEREDFVFSPTQKAMVPQLFLLSLSLLAGLASAKQCPEIPINFNDELPNVSQSPPKASKSLTFYLTMRPVLFTLSLFPH